MIHQKNHTVSNSDTVAQRRKGLADILVLQSCVHLHRWVHPAATPWASLNCARWHWLPKETTLTAWNVLKLGLEPCGNRQMSFSFAPRSWCAVSRFSRGSHGLCVASQEGGVARTCELLLALEAKGPTWFQSQVCHIGRDHLIQLGLADQLQDLILKERWKQLHGAKSKKDLTCWTGLLIATLAGPQFLPLDLSTLGMACVLGISVFDTKKLSIAFRL